MKKQRKSLDDALAEQFVYEESQPKSSSELGVSSISCGDAARTELGVNNCELRTTNYELSPSPQQPSKELSLMEKLQLEPKEVTKRFTVDLPESMHRKLSILSARTGRTKADIVRMLLDETLSDVKD